MGFKGIPYFRGDEALLSDSTEQLGSGSSEKDKTLDEEITPHRARHRDETVVPEEPDRSTTVGIFSQEPGTEAQKYAEAATLFNTGQYFESHERLEELWLISVPEDREMYHGLVQVSVALLHAERGNSHGAWTLFQRAIKHWQQGKILDDQTILRLRTDVEQALTAIIAHEGGGSQSCDYRPQMPVTMFWRKTRATGVLRLSDDLTRQSIQPERD